MKGLMLTLSLMIVTNVFAQDSAIKKGGKALLTPLACAPAVLVVGAAATLNTFPVLALIPNSYNDFGLQNDPGNNLDGFFGSGLHLGAVLTVGAGETIVNTSKVVTGNSDANYEVTKKASNGLYGGTRRIASRVFGYNSLCEKVRRHSHEEKKSENEAINDLARGLSKKEFEELKKEVDRIAKDTSSPQ